MVPDIVHSINNRRVIEIGYRGRRVIEPHVYGRGRNGQELLRAFQIEGASESDAPVGWKLFRVDEIEHLTVLDLPFDGPRPLYNPDDRAMASGILARL